MSNKIPVAVLAGTGSVGQRMISLLDGHPWFEVVEVTASERCAASRDRFFALTKKRLSIRIEKMKATRIMMISMPRFLESRFIIVHLPYG